jgi:hypothetical protein|tara:strand:+ start:48 stop:683 length:636 start_codon:yes stop_codon:yes gene_type:complete
MTVPANMTVYGGQHKAISVAGWADNQGYVVRFVHEPTGHAVEFPALISDFSDSHSPTFGQTHGANMHDPIVTLTKTDRAISFTLTVLNASLEEARYNRQCVNLLIQMLYPTVSESGNFVGKPFINIHMMNLLEGAISGQGITCVVEGLDYGIKFDDGILNDTEGIIELNRSGKEIYPQSLEISISAKAIIDSSGDEDRVSPFPVNYPSYGG